MERFKKAKQCETESEYLSGIELINHVFRHSINCEPTMQYEFPYLLSKDNMDNMIIIKDGDRAVSIASFLERDIFVESIPIKTASIGAVCTYEEYRGAQLSSKALDKVEEKMKEKGVELSLVSGTRTLYTRREYVRLNSMERYQYPSEDFDEIIKKNEKSYGVRDYSERDIIDISRIYNGNVNRFKREIDEFKTIIKSRPFTWGSLDYREKVVLDNGRIAAYLILQTIDGKSGVVVETGGSRVAIDYCIANQGKELNLEQVVYDIHLRDVINISDRGNGRRAENKGTAKIISYEKLMKSLAPYFKQYCDYVDEIEFKEIEEKNNKIFRIKIGKETIDLDSIGNMTELVFGDYSRKIAEKIEDAPRIREFIDAVFPVPLPYTENLNYQ